MRTNPLMQRGFSLVEVVVAIVAIATLAPAFVSVLRLSVESGVKMQQAAIMENIAASQLDKVQSGLFTAACTSSTVTVGVDIYTYTVTCSASGTPAAGGRHVVVSVTCPNCSIFGVPKTISLAGDAYDIW